MPLIGVRRSAPAEARLSAGEALGAGALVRLRAVVWDPAMLVLSAVRGPSMVAIAVERALTPSSVGQFSSNDTPAPVCVSAEAANGQIFWWRWTS